MRASRLAILMLVGASACREPNPAYKGAAAMADAEAATDATAPVAAGRDAPPPGDALASDGRVATAVPCPNDRELALCLRFEGAVKDESPAGHPFTATTVEFLPGLDGLALSHRAQSRVRTATGIVLDLRALTVEAWINLRAVPAPGTRAAILDNQRQFGLFVYPDGTLHCGYATTDSVASELKAPGVLRTGVWTSVACTVEGQTAALWVDGTMRASRAISGFGSTDLPGGFFVGTNIPSPDTSTPDPLDGLVDNVRVWRRARTAAEICAAAPACRR